MLHQQALEAGTVALPWGAVAALLLAGSVQLWAGLYRRSPAVAAATGLLTYLLLGVLAAPHGGSVLIPGNLAGALWLYGLTVVTFAVALLCRRILRRSG